MAHISPRRRQQVQQISVFKKASVRSRKMVIAELRKKPDAAVKIKTPVEGPGTTVKNKFKSSPPAPRTIKRTRGDDHVYDSSGAPEVQRFIVQRNDVVPAVAPLFELSSAIERPNAADGESQLRIGELHQGIVPSSGEHVPRSSSLRLSTVTERPTAADDGESQLRNGSASNGYHQHQAAVREVQIEHCSDHSPVVEAYRLVENGVTCAAVHSSPSPTAQMPERATASAQASGFGSLLRGIESPESVSPSSVASCPAKSVTEVNSDSEANVVRLGCHSWQRKSASPEYIVAPPHFHGLWNLGNTCYMNTVIQILHNLECFSADIGSVPQELPLSADSILLGLRKVFQQLSVAGKNEVIHPACLQQACEKYMIDFEAGVQQDAQEYLLNILDKIEEEIAFTQRHSREESQTVPVPPESICPTTRNFSCQVRNILSCDGCANIVNVEQSSRLFSLPLPQDRRDPEAETPDIEALMKIYFEAETLSRKCEKCGAETMKSETKIVQLPRVLILHINRFEIDCHMLCSKVSIPVRFAESLDLGDWCLDSVRGPCKLDAFVGNGTEYVNGGVLPALEDCRETNGFHSTGDRLMVPNSDMNDVESNDSTENGCVAVLPTSYRLHGVISHVGKLASCGHYMVDIYDGDTSKYVRCDDALVKEVPVDFFDCQIAAEQLEIARKVLPKDVFCEEKFSEAYVLLYVLQHNGGQHSRL